MNLKPLGKQDYDWGFEIVWANNDRYSGKILVFPEAGKSTQLVFHKTRAKSWFVNAGKFKLTFIDIKTGQMTEAVLEEGKTVDLAELGPHRLEALTNEAIIFEVGSPDDLEDVFKLSPDTSQTQPSEPQSNR